MKRRIKIGNVLMLIVFIVLIVAVVSVLLFKSNNKLEKMGYSKIEIAEIQKLSNDELDIIYKYNYNKDLVYMIKSENYNRENLDLYLKYTSKYNDIEYSKIFELINNENCKEEKLDKYIKYLKENDNIDAIVKYVNDYSDYDIDINSTSLSFIEQKYFIIDYLDRYLNYYQNNSDLSFKEVITRINSNLDYAFYTNTKKADLSKGMYTLVNKFNYLDNNYVPNDLVSVESTYGQTSSKLIRVAYDNFKKMADDMRELGMTILITTAYRSYSFQSTLYNNYVRADGVKNADTYSARPGYSEHQLGYSTDITNANHVSFDEFESTEEYKWLKDNAYKYGFLLRYPKDKEYITGYIFEPWHYRYVGVDIATYIYENDITYEEYYAYFIR